MKKDLVCTIWKDPAALSEAVAHFFVVACQEAIARRGKFVIALAGGTTPKRLYQLLSTTQFSRNIPWHQVYIFWGDERFVSHTNKESNYRMARETLLDRIPIPGKNIFPVPVKGDVKKASKKYETTIKRFFKSEKIVFDLILLGIGNDGHTASLFPGSDLLKEKRKIVGEVPATPKQVGRISFTLPLINLAARVLFFVSGKEKAGVVRRLLHAKTSKHILPAGLVNPEKGTVYWMLDEDAAASL